MNTAIELLHDYLTRKKISQYEFAAACGVEQSLVSRVISGVTALSGRNLPLLLSGIEDQGVKVEILAAHLRDQIPTDYVSSIEVHATKPIAKKRSTDVDPRKVFSNAAAELVPLLPMQTQTDVYKFIRALRTDSALRDILHGLIRYLPPANSAASSQPAAGRADAKA